MSKEEFNGEINEDKNCREIREHCHYIGKYREAAYSISNLR